MVLAGKHEKQCGGRAVASSVVSLEMEYCRDRVLGLMLRELGVSVSYRKVKVGKEQGPVSPLLQGKFNSQQFSVPHVIVPLCWREMADELMSHG